MPEDSPEARDGTPPVNEIQPPSEAPAASGSDGIPRTIQFTGSAREYFGIWIVNLALGIATVGVYSAWAKVRSRQYFLGHTLILGDRMEYHATGIMILKGRLIAVAAIAAYAALGFVEPWAQPVVLAALVPLYPVIINHALRFNARMTSWRNVRFAWHGRYWGVLKIAVLWPLAAILTLGLLVPRATRVGREYVACHHALGDTRFVAATRTRRYWGAYLRAIMLGALMSMVGGVVAFLVILALRSASSGSIMAAPAAQLATGLVGLAVWSLPFIYFRIAARNIAIDALKLGDAATFRSSLSPLRYTWIVATNFIVSILSVLMMVPWAAIRRYRYQAGCITVVPMATDATFSDSLAGPTGAVGEEYGEFAGIEIGL